MKAYAMKLRGYAIKLLSVAGTPRDTYIQSYDLNSTRLGQVTVTGQKHRAMLWDTADEAYAAYTTASSEFPLRADGKPNRPLTAFSVEIVPVYWTE